MPALVLTCSQIPRIKQHPSSRSPRLCCFTWNDIRIEMAKACFAARVLWATHIVRREAKFSSARGTTEIRKQKFQKNKKETGRYSMAREIIIFVPLTLSVRRDNSSVFLRRVREFACFPWGQIDRRDGEAILTRSYMYYTLVKVETKEENVELSQTFSRSD